MSTKQLIKAANNKIKFYKAMQQNEKVPGNNYMFQRIMRISMRMHKNLVLTVFSILGISTNHFLDLNQSTSTVCSVSHGGGET